MIVMARAKWELSLPHRHMRTARDRLQACEVSRCPSGSACHPPRYGEGGTCWIGRCRAQSRIAPRFENSPCPMAGKDFDCAAANAARGAAVWSRRAETRGSARTATRPLALSILRSCKDRTHRTFHP